MTDGVTGMSVRQVAGYLGAEITPDHVELHDAFKR